MKKLTLSLHDLTVESFGVAAEEVEGAGTVHARAPEAGAADVPKPPPPQTWEVAFTCPNLPGLCTCDGGPTCDPSGCFPCPVNQPPITEAAF